MPVRRIAVLLLLALPILEIVGFVVVGRAVGVLATLALVGLAALAGALVIRGQGFALAQRLRREARSGVLPAAGAGSGVLVLVAGFLLMVPGFVTDVAGLALLLPPVRHALWRRISGAVAGGLRRPGTPPRPAAQPTAAQPTLELGPDDYASGPARPTPWRRGGPE